MEVASFRAGDFTATSTGRVAMRRDGGVIRPWVIGVLTAHVALKTLLQAPKPNICFRSFLSLTKSMSNGHTMIPSSVYVNGRKASTEDLRVSSESYSTLRLLEELATWGGEEGGVSMFRSSRRAKVGCVGVLGVIGKLNVPTVSGGLDILVISSG